MHPQSPFCYSSCGWVFTHQRNLVCKQGTELKSSYNGTNCRKKKACVKCKSKVSNEKTHFARLCRFASMRIDSIFIQLHWIGFIFIFILELTSYHVTIIHHLQRVVVNYFVQSQIIWRPKCDDISADNQSNIQSMCLRDLDAPCVSVISTLNFDGDIYSEIIAIKHVGYECLDYQICNFCGGGDACFWCCFCHNTQGNDRSIFQDLIKYID